MTHEELNDKLVAEIVEQVMVPNLDRGVEPCAIVQALLSAAADTAASLWEKMNPAVTEDAAYQAANELILDFNAA